jgi:hypothetical protein
MMFILGGSVVTAEIDARKALQKLASALERVTTDDADLGSFDPGHLSDAADALATYQRARRDLLSTAEQQALRR